MVDRVWDDVDAVGIEIEQLDGAPANELARDDHGRGSAGSAVVGDAPERPARRAEELREIAMLRVVQGHDRRRLRPRRRHRQRVVKDVELCDVRRHRFRATRGERHRRDAERAAPSDGRVLDLDRGQTLGRVLRPRRNEHRVVVRPDSSERADELSRVRLGPARVSGRQREEGDADAHPLSLLTDPAGQSPDTAAARILRCPLMTPKTAILQGFLLRELPSTSTSSSALCARRSAAPAPIRVPARAARTSAGSPERRPSGSGRFRPIGRCGFARGFAAASVLRSRPCCAS